MHTHRATPTCGAPAQLVSLSAAVLSVLSPSVAFSVEPAVNLLPSVVIIDSTPLPGIELQREQVPANVQQLDKAQVENPAHANLTELLNKQLGSVFVNDIQNNPFQPDVNYRGFTASPLLGTAQGLSVYLDGVRLNQPFGDVVSWDLIPRSAISGIALMPGSNPVFGLNTLGGALSVHTKDGKSDPGTSIQALAGSHQRFAVEFEHGGSNKDGLDWFVTGNTFSEDGWRVDSPTDVRQLFGKLGWRNGASQLSLSVGLADNELTGNGLQELRLLQRDYSSVYTKPDETNNKGLFLNLAGTHSLSDSLLLSGNAYFRNIKTRTFNGDINDDTLDQNVYLTGTGDGSQANHSANRQYLFNNGFAGRFPTTAENTSNTPFPMWACIAQVGLRDEPAEKCNGLINRTNTDQDNYGLSSQLTRYADLFGRKNQLTVGAALDSSRVKFLQSTQLGYLNADRSITGLNAFADGVTGGEADGVPFDNRVDLSGDTDTYSVYATNTMTFNEIWHLTLSGRFNSTKVKNRDAILAGGGPGSLDGDHKFSRFNPAIGLAYAPSQQFNAYASYNEGNRTPSAIELGCADPNNPCKLPNSLAGDPPLNQVVTTTKEAGVHGRINKDTGWRASVFRADNKDDLLFVSDNTSGFGFFKNFGKTRRQGVELGFDTQIGPINLGADYTYLEATFNSPETVNGEANSSADADGRIQINKGNQIPLVPKHLMKVKADWAMNGQWSSRVGMVAVGSSFARGNENNQHQANGTTFLGPGESSGYALFDLGVQYKVSRNTKLFAHINNVFDRQYANASQLGATGFDADGRFVARPFSATGDNDTLVNSTFFAPGAPRTAWVGMRYTFDK
ncbi:MAG: TonB-dependent receptor [Limnobacter sp.]|nr:TonB-dependent receptor [Limnobacter sp.]